MEHKSENLVEKLNSTNYGTWKFLMKMFLIEKDCWEAIEQTEEVMNEEMTKKDRKALALIARCIEKSQLFLIRNHGNSAAAWKSIQDHYQRSNMMMKVKLNRRLREKKLAVGGSMPEHINAILQFIDQLQDIGTTVEDEEAVVILLTSLNDDYDGIITALSAWPEDRVTMANVRSSLIEEWERKAKPYKPIKERLGPKVNVKTDDKAEFICYYCKEPGHIARNCEKVIKKNKEAANAAESEWYSDGVFSSCKWIIDSGATSHMCSNRDIFCKFDNKIKSTISIANGNKIGCEGSGDLKLKIDLKHDILNTKLSNVLFVPKLRNNLLSVRALTEKGFQVTFIENKVFLQMGDGRKMDIGELKNNNYILRIKKEEGAALCVHEWHKRLAHKNLRDIKRMKSNFNIAKCECTDVCEACLQGKMTRQPFPKTATPVNKSLDCLVSDVCGPFQTQSISKARYFVTYIDVYSGYCEIRFIKKKSEVIEKTKQYIELIKTQTGKKPKVFRSDRAAEYMSTELQKYFEDEGIRYECTAGYTPEQNGVAERRNRTLMEAERSMRIAAGLPNNLWAEAVSTANYVQNRIIRKKQNKTPYEMFFGIPPKKQMYHEFGTEVYVMIPEEKRRKLDKKAEKMRFIGYDEQAKAFRLLTKSNAVQISREVKFINETPKDDIPEYFAFDDDDEQKENNKLERNIEENNDTEENEDVEDNGESGDDEESFVDKTMIERNESDTSVYTDAYEEMNLYDETEPATRRSTRTNFGKAPSYLSDYLLYKENEETDEEEDDEANAATLKIREPRTFSEAMGLPEAKQWMAAMQEELKVINKNKTWEEVEMPKDRKPIDCKWVYKVKYDERGNIAKFKARLVARGFSQRYGIDYDEVFAPVAKQQTLRMLLSVAGARGYEVKQYDVESAFLNGELSEEIYMRQPPGFKQSNKMLKLRKSLYGLKQAARVWNEKLHEALTISGCVQNVADKCLYTAKSGESVCYILMHVDDIVTAGNDKNFVNKIIESLNKHFIIKELGKVSHYLGIDITRDEKGNFSIGQPNYIDKIVEEAKLQDARNSRVPISTGYYKVESNGTNEQTKLLETNETYRKLIGMLLYVSTNTRPDISIAVSILSQRVSHPTINDMNEVKRMIRYLKTTRDERLKLSDERFEKSLKVYTDADWAEETRDRRSNSGFLARINGGTFAWSCRKQTLVALSSTEAEYIALSEATKEVIWIRELMKCFNISVDKPTDIYVDNQSCVKIAENEKFSNRTKHIDTKFHFIRDQARKKVIAFKYVPSNENLADMMTKPLGPSKLKELRNAAGLNHEGAKDSDFERVH